MGGEFNGHKYDVWGWYDLEECGVWNNVMKAKQYISDWNGIYAPTYEQAKEMARKLNKEYIVDLLNNS